MTAEVKTGDAKLPNVRALQDFRLKGNAVRKGEVVAKSDFAQKSDWLNLLNMPKPRVEETGDKVGPAPKPAAKAPGA